MFVVLQVCSARRKDEEQPTGMEQMSGDGAGARRGSYPGQGRVTGHFLEGASSGDVGSKRLRQSLLAGSAGHV